ncbi:hypothetical protein EJ08DRAFT_654819 [Tothia fuscella]|uniref:DNA repair protein RAD16 n=1 Tax=Tothia fuscella TaxID=1048955 RepID=A0A9P4TSD7_9PEZI|nr:hypothetical protein EJ08DRAFT_654819 [Tothia fuscella]
MVRKSGRFAAVANGTSASSPGNNTALPTTTPPSTKTRPSTRKSINRSFIPNSSDTNDEEIEDDDIIAVGTTSSTSKPRRVLHSVVVAQNSSTYDSDLNTSRMPPNPKAKAKSTPASRRIAASGPASASSRSSFASSTRDNSVGYNTPMTSNAGTPAAGGMSSFGKRSFTLGGLDVGASNKRKRAKGSNLVKSEVPTMDEEMAMRIQEEEWNREDDVVPDGESVGEVVEDSDEDDTPLYKRRKSAPKSFALEPDAIDVDSESESIFNLSDDDLALPNRRKSNVTISSLSSSALSSPASDTFSTLATVTATSRARKRENRRRRPNLEASMRGMGHMDRRKLARRQKLERSHPELMTMWDTLGKIDVLETEIVDQPESITRKLKKFQLEGLSWMIRQERTSFKGGLLGDEMGMGKTIQAVSLIMSDFPVKDPTLVLVPPVALMQWSNEISDYTNGKLKVLVVHNTNAKSKNLTPKTIKSYNVVIMSYNSLESMYRKQEKGWTRGENMIKEDSPIHAVKFHRLILDEAHSIKQRTTGVAKACFALKGEYKWCLSGTPVQNRIGEFFSLLRFLEVRPFADYFCEKCPCAELHWSIDDSYMCKLCKHSAAEHRSIFNEELLNPITGESMQLRSEAMDKLHMITARVMLRRMKKDHTSSMELPPKEIVIHNEFFGEIERDFSSSIMSNTARKFDTYVSQGVMLNNYANIFGLIMQMRQVANHPDLILKKHAEGGQNILVCNICDEPAEEAIRSRCKHEFCRSCVKSYVKTCEASGGDVDCPRCHIPLSIDWEQPDIEQDEEQVKKSSIINRIKMENWTSSTKIEMLVYDLYKLRSKKMTLKSIVFSQFTSMLQLIEWRLRRAGFNTVMLDGSMTPIQRQRSIDYFMNNTDVEVFLVSLKAGGVALNLTEASRVFIVDPWWNPAAEWQSADRCHRIGQTRPCVITRLCIEDSVESRMVMLQEKKASMISGTINNDKVAMDKLSPEDLQFLFRGT